MDCGKTFAVRASGRAGSMRGVLHLALACVVIGGCGEPGRGRSDGRPADTRLAAESGHPDPCDDAFTEYLVDPNTLRGLRPVVVDGVTVMKPFFEFQDYTTDGYPPGFVERAERMLEGEIWQVWDADSDWSANKLYLVVTALGDEGVFLEKDAQYVRLDSGSELVGINLVLKDYRFGREDFNNAQRVHQFLDEITFLHRGSRMTPCSSFALRTMGDLGDWLRGTEQSIAVLWDLCEDPEFVFEGDTWTVVFNTINADGSADEWTVIGEHHAETTSNEILRIDVENVLPVGSFSWAFIG